MLGHAERPLVERFGFVVLPRGPIQFGKTIENSRHIWMVWPEGPLDNRYRTLIQEFRLVILALPSVGEGEIVEACGDVRMLRAKGFFTDVERAFVECFGV